MVYARLSKRILNDGSRVSTNVGVSHVTNVPAMRLDCLVAPSISFSSSSREVLPPVAFKSDAECGQGEVHGMATDFVLKQIRDTEFNQHSFGHGLDICPITCSSLDTKVTRFESVLHAHSHSAAIRTTTLWPTTWTRADQHHFSTVRTEQRHHVTVAAACSGAISARPTAPSFSNEFVGARKTVTQYGVVGSRRWAVRCLRRWAKCIRACARTVGVLVGLANCAFKHNPATLTRFSDAVTHAGLGTESPTTTWRNYVSNPACAAHRISRVELAAMASAIGLSLPFLRHVRLAASDALNHLARRPITCSRAVAWRTPAWVSERLTATQTLDIRHASTCHRAEARNSGGRRLDPKGRAAFSTDFRDRRSSQSASRIALHGGTYLPLCQAPDAGRRAGASLCHCIRFIRPGGDRAASVLLGLLAQEGGA